MPDVDLSEIVPGLWQGKMPEAVPPEINAVLCLVGGGEREFRLPAGPFVQCLYAPIEDADFRGVDWLDATVDIVLRWRRLGLSVAVCCAAGKSRSSLVVAACLMKLRGWSRQQALMQVRGMRPVADPNPRFVDGLAAYGEHLGAVGDWRVGALFRQWSSLGSVLELGSHEGGLTFLLAKGAGRVLGLEGRAATMAKAEAARQAAGLSHVEFRLTDLETDDLSGYGRFDAIFHVGVLYHLVRPWESIRRCAAVSDRLLLWTHFCRAGQEVVSAEGYRGCWYMEGGLDDHLSGLSPRSFWLTLPDLLSVLHANGYRVVERRDDPDHPNGPAVLLAAERMHE